jgi:transposase InsO family protein
MSIEEIAELYADDEEDFPAIYPLSYAEIAHEQGRDATIKRLMKKSPNRYVTQERKFSGQTYTLVTRENKIVLPTSMQKKAVDWYHEILCHPGETRTELTMGQHFCWKGMRTTVVDVCKRCPTCQRNKLSWKKYGELPAKEAEVTPWKTLHIDTIGEYLIDVTVKNRKKTLKLRCLTMIDPATGWFEIAELKRGRADYTADLLERIWFNRYPWPTEVICDRGKEFMAEVIATLRDDYGIVRKPITTRNPQANAMVERAHQTLGNMLRSQDFQNRNDIDMEDPFAGVLAAVGFAMRATVHTTTRATPSQLVFNRDAIHNVGFKADWLYIKNRKQALIDKNNKRENATRIPHQYQVGDQVLVKADLNRKYDTRLPYSAPHTIERVYANGTVKLRQVTQRGGAVTQIWNIRNIKPYKD